MDGLTLFGLFAVTAVLVCYGSAGRLAIRCGQGDLDVVALMHWYNRRPAAA